MSGARFSDPCHKLDYIECHVAVILWKVFSPTFLIVGIFGNILAIIVLSRKRMRITTTSVHLRILAIVDSVVLVVQVLRSLISYYENIDIRELTDLSCKIHMWLSYSVTTLSCWMLSVIAIDRLIAVKLPLWAKSHCNRKTALIIGIIVIVVVPLLNSHLLWSLYRDEVYVSTNVSNASVLLDIKCSPSNLHYIRFYNQVWPILTFILFSFAPIICLITCNIVLFRALSLRNEKIVGRKTTVVEGKREKKDIRSLTNMLIVVCLFFIAISVPTCVYLIIEPYVFTRTSPHDVARRTLAWAVAAFFLYSNNAFNFIIYCLSGSMFRRELNILLRQIRLSITRFCGRRIHPILNENIQADETKAGTSMVDNNTASTNVHTIAYASNTAV